jgi:hypothetical protein
MTLFFVIDPDVSMIMNNELGGISSGMYKDVAPTFTVHVEGSLKYISGVLPETSHEFHVLYL